MKPVVKLIMERKQGVPFFEEQLYSVFGDAIQIVSYSLEDPAAFASQGEDVIFTGAFSAENFREFKRKNRSAKPLLGFNLVLPCKNLHYLDSFPKGSVCLLVNTSRAMAEETIVQLGQAGYGFLTWVPYYPGCPAPSQATLAATVGEMDLVPRGPWQTLDLGERQIDIVSVIELAVRVGCSHLLKTRRFFNYFEKQFNPSAGVSILVEENQSLERRFQSLIQLFEDGVMELDRRGRIVSCNFRAADILACSRAELIGADAAKWIPDALLEQCNSRQTRIIGEIDGGEHPCHVCMDPITVGTEYQGAFVLLQTGEKKTLRGDRREHVAKYRFRDICGQSDTMQQTVELAKKMSRTNSTILISGESGTGKELFAHAIHNNSARAEAPFVAVNCAALPDTLLESELFGYEEGAFTGAKKGGKPGLFELANGGSVFLDEIEGMSNGTQLKLLRVLQEREIVRLGGDRVIPIDVRFISASNENLQTLMATGRFRQDLFYRVSTLPLELPPLRCRREDIPLLIANFQSDLHMDFILTEEAIQCLLRYDWPGNIRELRNCVEYLGCQNLPVIDLENLPHTVYNDLSLESRADMSSETLRWRILELLSLEKCGRKKLGELLKKSGYSVPEPQLRRELEALKSMGLITSGTGRGGSSLTEAGRETYQNRRKQV